MMTPLYTFYCENCKQETVTLVKVSERVECEGCNRMLTKRLSACISYKIKGDNSASTSPKRGGLSPKKPRKD